MNRQAGQEGVPPGWDYNPSTWGERIPIVLLALLGALGYLADAVAGVIGGKERWRKMPWIVVLFGLAVGPLGIVSITLVIFQPVLFDAWCTLCLSTAVISLLMIGPAADEVLASLQYLKRRRDEGASVWRSFWGLDGAPEASAQRPARSEESAGC